jgi:hypothetical protein
MKRRDGAAKVRLGGLVVLLAYWSSILWLPGVFKLLGITAKDIPALARLLEVYYWPPMTVLGLLTHALPYPAFMFYGPYFAVALSAGVCCGLWWLATSHYVSRSSSA